MRHFLLIILVFGKVSFSYSQTKEQLKKQAIMLVHSDLNDFSLPYENFFLDSILNFYNVDILKSDGIFECIFFAINLKCIKCNDCLFILAYSFKEKLFFRLQGFKYNEFNDFYNLVLLDKSVVPTIKGKNKRKILKQIINQVHIDKIDIKKFYSTYYKKYKASLFDKTSCYRKSVIKIYCNPTQK